MKLQNKISNWLRDYITDNNLKTFVVGISGGIDSAVTSTLCAMTGVKTYAVVMPIHQNPSETDRGIEHSNWLIEKFNNVELIKIELTDSNYYDIDVYCNKKGIDWSVSVWDLDSLDFIQQKYIILFNIFRFHEKG